MRTAIVYNPSAGSERGETIATAVERSLGGRGFDVQLHPTRGPGDGTTIAEKLVTEVDVLVVVGGDGTINEVVNGMARGGMARGGMACGGDEAAGETPRRGAKLGIVPAGTVNVLALELGIPFRLERACDIVARGKTRILDLGKANERRFTLMAGVGVDALTVRNIDLRAKRRFKELAFLERGLKEGFSTQPPAFLVRVDGEEHRATFFVAGNCHYYAGRLSITPKADPADGLLDLLIFTGTTRSSLAVFWLEVPGGLHVHNAHVTYRRTKRAEVLPLGQETTVWFQTDGEAAGSLPMVVEIDAHVLEVLVP